MEVVHHIVFYPGNELLYKKNWKCSPYSKCGSPASFVADSSFLSEAFLNAVSSEKTMKIEERKQENYFILNFFKYWPIYD